MSYLTITNALIALAGLVIGVGGTLFYKSKENHENNKQKSSST